MEAKRVAQAEAEQRVLDEAERVATAERLADEEEQAKRKASFFYSMFNKVQFNRHITIKFIGFILLIFYSIAELG